MLRQDDLGTAKRSVLLAITTPLNIFQYANGYTLAVKYSLWAHDAKVIGDSANFLIGSFELR